MRRYFIQAAAALLLLTGASAQSSTQKKQSKKTRAEIPHSPVFCMEDGSFHHAHLMIVFPKNRAVVVDAELQGQEINGTINFSDFDFLSEPDRNELTGTVAPMAIE